MILGVRARHSTRAPTASKKNLVRQLSTQRMLHASEDAASLRLTPPGTLHCSRKLDVVSSVTRLEKYLVLCFDALRCCQWLRVAAEGVSLLPVNLVPMPCECTYDMIDMPAINARAAHKLGK